MNLNDGAPDDEILALVAAGDREAWEALVRRYLAPLYDLAIRITLDPSSAATAAALGRAAQEAGARAPELSVRAWLLGLARDEALTQPRVRSRGDGAPDDPSDPASDAQFSALPDDHPFAHDPEVAAWAWQAARAQRPRDYSLLDLAVRRALTPEEIATVASLSRGGSYTVIGRLRGSFEESFTSSVLFNRGIEACSDLDSIVAGATSLSPALRRDISRHAEACLSCRQARAGQPSPAELLAVFTNIDPGPALFGQVIAGTAAAGAPLQGALPLTGGPAVEDGGAKAAEETVEDLAGEGEAPEAPEVEGGVESSVTAGEEEGAEPDVAEEPASELGSESDVSGVGAAPEAGELAVGGLAATVDRRRIRFEGYFDDGAPPRRPWQGVLDWFNEDRPMRAFFVLLIVGLTVIAGYVGLALGAALNDGDGGSAGALPTLPTREPGAQELACGSGPITVETGTRSTITFDSRALTGYTVADVQILPLSDGATPRSLDVRPQQGLSVLFEALAVSAPGRTDEYRLSVTFAQGSERTTSDCTVRVRAAAPTGTPTASASPSPSPSPTLTPTPRPAAPIVQPTATPVPPTLTPEPTKAPDFIPTWTPSPTPTNTPTPPPPPTPIVP